MLEQDDTPSNSTQAVFSKKKDIFFGRKTKWSEQISDGSCKFQLYPNCQEECKITKIFAIVQSWQSQLIEACIFIITGSISLLILHKFPMLRMKLFMKIVNPKKSNQVFVIGPDQDMQFIKYLRNHVIHEDTKVFQYRFQRYSLLEDDSFAPYFESPFGMKNSELLSISKGFDTATDREAISNSKNGLNKTDVPDKGLIYLAVSQLLSPFYFFQAGSVTLWLYEKYTIYSFVIVISSLFSFLAKLYTERSNFLKLKKLGYLRKEVTILRRGHRKICTSDKIIFGDVVVMNKGDTAACDLLVLSGSAIVSESSLTGDCTPNTKTELPKNDEYYVENKQHIIYSGSIILQCQNLKCVAILIGFETLRGKMIRSIIYSKNRFQGQFKTDGLYFIFILGLAAGISFLTSLPTFIDKLQQGLAVYQDVIIRCLDLITISIPPALPLCLSFGLTISMHRLRKRKVFCIDSSNINICGMLRILCFDKTGTLTNNLVNYKMLSGFQNKHEGGGQQEFHDYIGETGLKEMSSMQRIILGACHNLKLVDGNLIGDPLDLEMFRSSGWGVSKKTEFQLQQEGNGVIQEIINEKDNNNEIIHVLKCFPFESQSERMSTIVRFNDSTFILTKGSPEKFKDIAKVSSLPAANEGSESYNEKLYKLTKQGFRVISLGYKQIDPYDIGKKRQKLEQDIIFAGFLVFENQLKSSSTADNIKAIGASNVQMNIVTGDNPQTSINIAKQCGILSLDNKTPILDYSNGSIFYEIEGVQTIKNSLGEVLNDPSVTELVITGRFFQRYFSDNDDEEQISILLSKTKVFARMKPEQKQNLVTLLQTISNLNRSYTFVGVCGDGANDSSALKSADMGLSLGNSEASMASSFNSRSPDVGIIEYVLREGRCCLTKTFTCYKFIALYSMIQVSTTGIIYFRGSTPANYQFLYWDLFIVLPLAFLIGLTNASNSLNAVFPQHRLFSLENVTSVLGHGLISFIFQLIGLGITTTQSWYINPISFQKQSGLDPSEVLTSSFDNTVLFWLSNFQYISVIISFSVISTHKKPFYYNIGFTIYAIMAFILSFFLVFTTNTDIVDFFEIYPALVTVEEGDIITEMDYSWRFFAMGLIIVNIIVTMGFELVIVKMICKTISHRFPSYFFEGENLERGQNQLKDKEMVQQQQQEQSRDSENNFQDNNNNTNNNNSIKTATNRFTTGQ